MPFDITGKLHRVFDTENKTSSFQTREFVIELPDDRYPEYIKFQLTQDRCSLIDNYQGGDFVKVTFDLKGREWQGKYFTNLNAWRIEAGNAAPAAPIPNRSAKSFDNNDAFPAAADEPIASDLDDLPF
ncbi:MAG: DUF3127 domain-containing protein [Saprospiraceae bacterium]|nr:DUF3127 domain-containing protein [Saprospiraceae bacterium]MBP7679525.1 DUF3127 domain-containing protein [Saprospiraceae bacterium]